MKILIRCQESWQIEISAEWIGLKPPNMSAKKLVFFRGAGQIHANNFLTERERRDDAKEVK